MGSSPTGAKLSRVTSRARWTAHSSFCSSRMGAALGAHWLVVNASQSQNLTRGTQIPGLGRGFFGSGSARQFTPSVVFSRALSNRSKKSLPRLPCSRLVVYPAPDSLKLAACLGVEGGIAKNAKSHDLRFTFLGRPKKQHSTTGVPCRIPFVPGQGCNAPKPCEVSRRRDVDVPVSISL